MASEKINKIQCVARNTINKVKNTVNIYTVNRSNLLQLGVGGNDVPKNAPLTLMKYKCFLCGIPKARKTCKTLTPDAWLD
jgi:hypothetical protein